MNSSKCLAVTCFVLILSSLLLALETQHIVLNSTRVLTVHRGMSVNISCNYTKLVDTNIFRVILNTDHQLCSCVNNNKSWTYQRCSKGIRLIWIAETKEISYELSNLQINKSGTYRCIVERQAPPPTVNLGNDQTFLQVVASPFVSISCVKDPDGFPMIQCSSEWFYPSDLQQVWLRDGELQNISQTHNTNRTNTDGSITFNSYLHLSSEMSDHVNYSCWVNHSSLNKPVVLHLSPADCYERNDFEGITKPGSSVNLSDNMKVALIISTLLLLIILIISVVLQCFRRANHRSPVEEVSVTPNSVLYSHLQTEVIYSLLGDHRPVPCNSPNQSLITTSTLNTD